MVDENQTWQISVQYSPEEIGKLTRILNAKASQYKFIFQILGLWICMLISLSLTWLITKKSPDDLIGGLSLELAIFMFSYYLLLRFIGFWTIKARLDEKGNALSKRIMTISQEGIEDTSLYSKSFTSWQGILSIQNAKEFILFYVDKLSAYSIPKSAIGDEAKSKDFVVLAKKYWNAANPKIIANDPKS